MRIVNSLGNLLISEKEFQLMDKNHRIGIVVKNNDPIPVVKLFMQDASVTLFLSEIDIEEKLAYGLCDQGNGNPEYCYVYLEHLLLMIGKEGLPIERDKDAYLDKPLSYYEDKPLREIT